MEIDQKQFHDSSISILINSLNHYLTELIYIEIESWTKFNCSWRLDINLGEILAEAIYINAAMDASIVPFSYVYL